MSFKTWLSPIQVRIITVGDEQNDYAEKLLNIINGESFRADFDDREETVGKKIRQSELDWIPYTIIIGKKEQENQTISIRNLSKIYEGSTKENQDITQEGKSNCWNGARQKSAGSIEYFEIYPQKRG